MRAEEASFAAMLREMLNDEGGALLEEERRWHDRVPAQLDRTAMACLSAPSAAAAERPIRTPSLPASAALSGWRLALAGLGAAALLAAGTVAAVPALRARVVSLLPAPAVQETEAPGLLGDSPGDYQIPLPGPDYTVTDEARSERLAYRWFTSPDRELLVKIAYRLQEDRAAGGETEYVQLGPLWGTYCEADSTRLLILRDGPVFLLFESWGGTREELVEYAERLIASNR